MNRLRKSCQRIALLTLLQGAVITSATASAEPNDVARVYEWLSGEWNNQEQVWQQAIDANDTKIERKQDSVAHRHTVVAPVDLPALGPHVLYVQQSTGADQTQVTGQWLLRLQAGPERTVRLETVHLTDPQRWRDAHRRAQAWSHFTAADTSTTVGCELLLRRDDSAQAYTGAVPNGTCTDTLAVAGQTLFRSETLQLQAGQWSALTQWRDAQGHLIKGNKTDTATRNRKVRYFEGWVWFRNAGPGAAADDKDTSFTAKFMLHNEGQRMTVLHKDGRPSPFVLELAKLTYQNTRRPVLKFALRDRATDKTLSYVWAHAEAPMIGMNLGWFQSGMTERSTRVHYGY